MNSSEASRQIQQMIAFITQEAKEKAEEIEVKTESAFTAEKLNLTMQMSLSIRETHERKKKDRLIQKRIERSKLVNSSRMTVMKDRDELVKDVKNEILSRMSEVCKHKQYPDLVRLMIVEACMRITEEEVFVQCRKEDEAIVKAQLRAAEQTYKDVMKNASGKAQKLKLALDTKDYLAPAPSKGSQGASCRGGIVLHACNKKIICRNTLDSRLDLAFTNLKPQVRGLLFGFREAPTSA